ncbi:MAG: lipoyl protein ligase domain-containing protein, partial [Cyanobium sp.]
QPDLEERWLRLVQEGRLALARRPSGGGAVLHGGDLTYALLWPDPPRQRREAYRLCCGWLRKAFAALGQPLEFGAAPARRDQPHCFASSTAADLVHTGGAKRIGSAQLWRSGCLLQHGSILLAPPAPLWRELFDHDPPPLAELPLAGAALMAQLRRCAERHWQPLGGQALELKPLGPAERAAIRLGRQRYMVPTEAGEGWGETSPAATMPRAT